MHPEFVTIVRTHSSPYEARRAAALPVLDAQDFSPAGAAQRASYGAGSFAFRMAAQTFQSEPAFNAATFSSHFAHALAAIMPAGTRATARLAGISRGPSVDPEGILNIRDREGPSWWVTITGTIQSAAPWNLTGQAGLNRVIARALYSAVIPYTVEEQDFFRRTGSYPPSARYNGLTQVEYHPRDGGQLHAMLDNLEACGSHQNTRQMWMRACTTVTEVGPNALVDPPSVPHPPDAGRPLGPALPPTPERPLTRPDGPAVPPRPPPPTQPTPLRTPPGPAGSCRVMLRSVAWIRPTQTFAHHGPVAPVGSVLTVLGRTGLTSGTFRLYQVRVETSPAANVVGAFGYAALDANDVATANPSSCTENLEVARTPTGGGSPAPTPSGPLGRDGRPQAPQSPGTPSGLEYIGPGQLPTAPIPGGAPTVPAVQGAVQGAPANTSSLAKTFGIVAGTALVLGIGAAVIVNSEKKGRSR